MGASFGPVHRNTGPRLAPFFFLGASWAAAQVEGHARAGPAKAYTYSRGDALPWDGCTGGSRESALRHDGQLGSRLLSKAFFGLVATASALSFLKGTGALPQNANYPERRDPRGGAL
jgi:hypothetical protein